jgi:hypothetical protein
MVHEAARCTYTLDTFLWWGSIAKGWKICRELTTRRRVMPIQLILNLTRSQAQLGRLTGIVEMVGLDHWSVHICICIVYYVRPLAGLVSGSGRTDSLRK